VLDIACGDLSSLIIQSNYVCFGKHPLDTTICSGNGICQSNGLCLCEQNFQGNECQFTTCYGKNSSDPQVCSGNGNCTDFNICKCSTGYDGFQCEMNFTTIDNNVVYSMGQGYYGSLGDGTVVDKDVPTKVISFNYGIKKIFAGYYSTYILSNTSRAYAFGQHDVIYSTF
jgi:alpha-tubulin suppressor-like RCC1 family protein